MGFIFPIVDVLEVLVESTVQPSATEVASSSPTLKSSSVDEITEKETSETPYMTTVEIGPTLSTTTTNAPSSSSTSPRPHGNFLFTPRVSGVVSVNLYYLQQASAFTLVLMGLRRIQSINASRSV